MTEMTEDVKRMYDHLKGYIESGNSLNVPLCNHGWLTFDMDDLEGVIPAGKLNGDSEATLKVFCRTFKEFLKCDVESVHVRRTGRLGNDEYGNIMDTHRYVVSKLSDQDALDIHYGRATVEFKDFKSIAVEHVLLERDIECFFFFEDDREDNPSKSYTVIIEAGREIYNHYYADKALKEVNSEEEILTADVEKLLASRVKHIEANQ